MESEKAIEKVESLFNMGNSLSFDREKMSEADGKLAEGYWSNADIPSYDKYPSPKSSSSAVPAEFVERVKRVQEAEGTEVTEFRGYSHCRICGKEDNGLSEFAITRQDGVRVVWPEGLLHYYTEHSVMPSKEFYELINSLTV